ncbi:MAG: hypothetical protein J7L51_02860 [Desulfurococcales archaeon]|nr:hypothetical protein [Desulfurococcales archaeon]
MANTCTFIIDLREAKKQPEETCQLVKSKFSEYLNKGYSAFKFIVITHEELHKWLDCIRCVIEFNISATITVDQVREVSEELVKGTERVSDFLTIKECREGK